MQLARSSVLVKHGLLRVKNSYIITGGDESVWLLLTGLTGIVLRGLMASLSGMKFRKCRLSVMQECPQWPRSSILNARTIVAPFWFVHAFLCLTVKADVWRRFNGSQSGCLVSLKSKLN